MKRTVRLGECPSQTPIGRAGLDPLESIRHGRPFGEQGSILCGHSRVQGRDPPGFWAGNTGKSQTTHPVSPLRRCGERGKPQQSGRTEQSAYCETANSEKLFRFRLKPPPQCQSVGQGFHLGWVTGCGRRKHQPNLQQFPLGRSGEKYLDPRGAGPGEQGSRPRVSMAVGTLAKPDNAFSIRPRPDPAQGFGALSA